MIFSATASPAIIRDFSFVLNEPGPFYNIDAYPFEGAASISPDGRYLAGLVRTPGNDNPRNGAWLLDLESGDFDLIATNAELLSPGLPDWAIEEGRHTPTGLAWLDEQHVIVSLSDFTRGTEIASVLLVVDADSRAITPLIDFRGLPTRDALIESTGDFTPVYDAPNSAVALPTARGVIYLNADRRNDAYGVSGVSLDAPGEPWRFAAIAPEDFVFAPMFQASIGDDGQTVRALIFGTLLTFERD